MNVNTISSNYDFEIIGPSYIGRPTNNSFMFLTKKVEGLINNLNSIEHCLIFVENGVFVKDIYKSNNCFVFSDNPQLEYAKFALAFKNSIDQINKKRVFKNVDGSLIGENVKIGNNTFIESGCIIGHDVVIGDNCTILAKSIIKNAVIGNNVFINENSSVGTNGFNITVDENGNKFRIPTLGKVIVGNNVEIGAFDTIASGIGGNTIVEDYAKLDARIHVGHDVILRKNVEITAGCILGGFVEIQEGAYLGLGSIIKNRITIGRNAFIGMGSVVMKPVGDDIKVLGNPARPLPQERK